jgi:hypothetical protein
MDTFDPTIAMMLRLALAGLLGWAMSHKLQDFSSFRSTVREYKLLPVFLVAPAAVVLVVAEIVIAIGYLLPAGSENAGIAGACLFALYAIAIQVNLLRGRTHIDCGCFGPARNEPISPALVWRNLLLAAASAACLIPAGTRELIWLDGFTIAGGILFFAAMYLAANRLITLSPVTTTSVNTIPVTTTERSGV